MCGITGFFHRADGPHDIQPESLRRMTSVLNHRGPDEAGTYLDDYAGLGHVRLSIVGLKGGAQPIGNEDRTLWIVYNGEVYNHPELRVALERRGHRFRTTTDTEVILHLYEEKGPACLQELNGEFAFAIWNAQRHELFLARDRLGVRPLHYAFINNSLVFASEIKSIFVFPGARRELCAEALDQAFTFWSPLPGRTPFRDVSEILPGHWMKVKNDSLVTRRYWSLPLLPRCEQKDLPPAVMADEIRSLLVDAVKVRLRADVPVGAYLSGGLDSSGIASIVAGQFDRTVKTFGIRFEEPGFDEGHYQRRVVEHLGVNHASQVASNASIRASYPQVVWHAEKPLLRTAPAPMYLLSKLVRDHGIKVVLTGEGADEFFGGYDIFRETLVRSFWARRPDSPMRAMLIRQLHTGIFSSSQSRIAMSGFFARGLDDPRNPLFSHLPRWQTTSRAKQFFAPGLANQLVNYDACAEAVAQLPPSFQHLDCLGKAQFLEASIFLSNYLLCSQGDRVAMGNSIEIRFPFLDHRLLEYLGHVPSPWKILGMNEKHMLKKVLSGMIPHEVLTRPKQAYRAPIQTCLAGNRHSDIVQHCLEPEQVRSTGLFDPGKVAMLLSKIAAGNTSSETEGMALAGIISTQLLHRQFISDFQPSHPYIKLSVEEDRRSSSTRRREAVYDQGRD